MALPGHDFPPDRQGPGGGAIRADRAVVRAVHQHEGVWVFDITEGKTESAVRKIPVHKELIKLGILDHRERMAAAGEELLFPEFRPAGIDNKYGHEFGEVVSEAVMARDFLVDGKPILECELAAPEMDCNKDNPDLAEWVVGVKWLKTLPLEDAVLGRRPYFSAQHIVCKLSQQQTLDELAKVFGPPDAPAAE